MSVQCYYPNGTPSADTPCGHGSKVCCAVGFQCLENGMCSTVGLYQGGYFARGSCTDATWQDGGCPKFCLTGKMNSGAGIERCDSGDWCCIDVPSVPCNCTSGNNTVQIGGALVAYTTVGTGATSTSSSVTLTSSTTSSTPTQSSGGGGLSSGAKIGIGAGVGAGGLVLIVALVLLFCLKKEREKTKRISMATNLNDRNSVDPSALGHYQQSSAPPSAMGYYKSGDQSSMTFPQSPSPGVTPQTYNGDRTSQQWGQGMAPVHENEGHDPQLYHHGTFHENPAPPPSSGAPYQPPAELKG